MEINKIYCEDCRVTIDRMEDNSIDSMVTDPPAGIAFMGKEWDKDKGGRDQWIEWMTGVMRECLRMLKPGAHALVWALPRTSHWTATALENAGFEIRDVVNHIFGSGFPKSLDISKAIDKRGGTNISWFGKWLRNWRESRKITQKEIAELFPSKTGGLTGCVANWELGLNLPTCEQFNKIKNTFGFPFESIHEAEREIVGKDIKARSTTSGSALPIVGGETVYKEWDITAPATPEAKQWDGWGTGLKPATEFWILVRKPLSEKTVAENVLKWGTGGINIDGCRVEIPEGQTKDKGNPNRIGSKESVIPWSKNGAPPYDPTQGRYPANVIHDGSEEVLAGFPNTKSGGGNKNHKSINYPFLGFATGIDKIYTSDQGSAARFFYAAKASKRDRDEGLEGFEINNKVEHRHGRYRCKICNKLKLDYNPCQCGEKAQFERIEVNRNNHPTVKSTELMKYLCRLITPPGGTIIDPFMGSGSTGKAAILEGFNFIGIEQDKEYFKIAEARIEFAEKRIKREQSKLTLF